MSSLGKSLQRFKNSNAFIACFIVTGFEIFPKTILMVIGIDKEVVTDSKM